MKSYTDHMKNPDESGYVLIVSPMWGQTRTYLDPSGERVRKLTQARVFATVPEAHASRKSGTEVRSYDSMRPRKRS
jgi:hypothetical protein